jgi:hypothetical protein
MILQPFQHSITEQGESATMVVGDTITHAVLKKPKLDHFSPMNIWEEQSCSRRGGNRFRKESNNTNRRALRSRKRVDMKRLNAG